MIITTDIETYHQFKGTEESYEHIKNHQLDPSSWNKKITDLKKGYWYPVLNSQDYAIGVLKTHKEAIKIFHDPKEHWEYIEHITQYAKKHNKKVYVYGHNHRYDFYGYAKDHIFTENMKLVIEFPLFAIYEDVTYFLDTMSFNPVSLKKIGDQLGFPKLEMPREVKDLKDLEKYCTQDVEITHKAVTHLKEQIASLGYKPKKILTAGQLAMTTFLTSCRNNNIHYHFMHSGKIYCSKNMQKVKMAYRGARCQAFQKGTYENVTLIDINSMYTHAMVNMEFPNLQEPLFIKKPKYKDWNLIKDCIGVINCTMEINTKELPYLMAYTKVAGKPKPVTVFPKKSKVIGTWTIQEIKKALTIPGYTLASIHWVECYKKSKINPFKDYLTKLYDLGIKNKNFKLTSKLLRNNLYGKFAQSRKNHETKYVYREDLDEWQNKGWTFAGFIDDKAIIKKETGDYIPSYYNPLISALITATARDYHYELLKKIPKEDLLYCDTDSVIFKGNHINKFEINEEKLGALKIEGEGKILIRGRKNYQFNKKVKISGLPKRDINAETIKNDVVPIRRQVGIKEAVATGKSESIGTFKTVNFNIVGLDIDSLPIPTRIDEKQFYKK